MPKTKAAPVARSAEEVAARINFEFAARRVSWPKFAAMVGWPQATLYRLARGLVSKPWQRTLDEVWEALDRLPKQRTGV